MEGSEAGLQIRASIWCAKHLNNSCHRYKELRYRF